MLNCYTRIYKARGDECNTVKFSVYYSKGGYSIWSGLTEPCGYYVSIRAYERKEHNGYLVESFSVGTGHKGINSCILPCERQSKKRYEAAKVMALSCLEENLTAWCKREGVTIEDMNEYTVEEEARQLY